MSEFRMRAFFGILGLAATGFLVSSVTSVGCSSSNGGSGGSSGTAGSSGSAGSTGSAGTTGGGGNSGGSGGGGGASAPLGCQVSDLPRLVAAPAPAGTIADFTAVDGGTSIPIGGTFAYPQTGGPTITIENGGMHVVATSTSMAMAQYWGVGIYFNGNDTGTNCVDATQYTGIKFDISGTIGGTMCSGQYAANDSAHSDSTSGNPPDPKAGGPAGSYAPQAPLTVTTAVATVMMPFTTPVGGSPATAIDKSKLTGVQWQFTTAASGTCMVDIIIDNVAFY